MHNNVHTVHRSQKSFAVAHITNEIPHGWMIISMHFHLVLLQFIPAEDDDFLRLFFLQGDLCKLLAKRTSPARDKNSLIFPIHVYLFAFSYLTVIPIHPTKAYRILDHRWGK